MQTQVKQCALLSVPPASAVSSTLAS